MIEMAVETECISMVALIDLSDFGWVWIKKQGPPCIPHVSHAHERSECGWQMPGQ